MDRAPVPLPSMPLVWLLTMANASIKTTLQRPQSLKIIFWVRILTPVASDNYTKFFTFIHLGVITSAKLIINRGSVRKLKKQRSKKANGVHFLAVMIRLWDSLAGQNFPAFWVLAHGVIILDD